MYRNGRILVAGADILERFDHDTITDGSQRHYELVCQPASGELVTEITTESVSCLVIGDGVDSSPATVIEEIREVSSLAVVYSGRADPAAVFEAGATAYLPTDADDAVIERRLLTAIDATAFREGRDETDHHRQIQHLHDVGVELAGSNSPDEVYELMVSAAEDILDLDMCIVDSVQAGRLRIEATSSEIMEYDEALVDSPEAGIAGKAYREGESILIRDTENDPEAKPTGAYRSGITVPISEFGVFQAAAEEVGAFDRTDLELVQILTEHVKEALRRLDQEQQLHERREQLLRENERLDEFASIVSHDLRNPLNVAQLRFDLVKAECESDHLDSIESALCRMETLIDDVLTLARGGKPVSDFEAISLTGVASAAWRNVDTGDATIEIGNDATVLANESRLQQLLENLFRNAVEHATPDGDDASGLQVRVETLEAGFYVEDSGVGIPDEVQEVLFEHGVTTNENGSGIGLAIVTRIAEAHGWSVDLSDAADGGARFELTGVEFVEE